MRVSKERAAQNHERIVTAAARLFRERGLEGVGVDALMDAAGMTHGSLYSQFGSKARLAAEALARALAINSDRMAQARSLDDWAARYLSPEHRDRPGDGCVMAALGGEIARQDGPIREDFTQAVRATARRVEHLLPEGRRDGDEALAIVATLVGALTLARAVDDPDLSDRLLAAARAQLKSRRHDEPAAPNHTRRRGRPR